MDLKYQSLFVFLLLLLGASLLYYYKWLKKSQRTYFISSLDFLKHLKKSVKPMPKWWNYLTMILFTLTCFFLIVLISRPQISRERNNDKFGIDFVMAIDSSFSMAAKFEGNKSRTQAVQEIIQTFIGNIKTDRVGLVAFSGNAFTLCPLTHDYTVFTFYLKQMGQADGFRVGGGGTAVGDAILYSVDKFQKNVDRTKVIILITDGASNQGMDPVKAAEYAKKNKVKIYTLLATGENMQDREAAKSMQQVATITDGVFFDVKNTQELNDVFEEIEKLEKKKLVVSSPKIYFDNPTPYVVFVALLWIAYIGAKVYKKEYV